MFHNFTMIVATALALSSCAGGSNTDKPSKENAVNATPVKSETPISAENSTYLNGITEENGIATSGPVHLHGSLSRNAAEGSWVILWETEGKEVYKYDSTQVKGGKYDFGTQEFDQGFYALSHGQPNNSTGIILNPAEKDVELNFPGGRLETSGQSVNSKENEAWFMYAPVEKAHYNQIKNLRKNAKNPAMKAKMEKLMAAEDQKLLDLQHKIINDYPGTFVAKIMTWKQNKWGNDKSRYWDDIDFNDVSIIRSPIINDRIQDYMIKFSGGTDNGFYNAVDLIHGKSEVNPDVNALCLLTMLEGFYSSKKENVCAYIMDNYIYGENCGEGDAAEILKDRALGVKNLRIGGNPPNFDIPYPDGSTLNLHREFASNEYTMLFFWSSWCHKCEQETPEYKKLYDAYKSKGFQIVGISVDNNRNAWLKGIEDKGTTWTNVSMLNGWNSPVADGYYVSETPTIFVVDKNMEIVLKPERWFEVQKFLQENL